MTMHSPEGARQLDVLSAFQIFAEEAVKKGGRVDLATFATDLVNGSKHWYSPLGPGVSASEVRSALVKFVDTNKVLLGKLSELEEQAEKDPYYKHQESHCTIQGRPWLAASGTFFFGVELNIDDFRHEENSRTYFVQGKPRPLTERIKARFSSLKIH